MRRLLPAFVVAIAACEDPAALDWQLTFGDPGQSTEAALVIASIREGGCSGETVYETHVVRGSVMEPAPPELDDGTWGFAGRARNSDCEVIASGCLEVGLPIEGPVVVSMAAFPTPSADCAGAGCMDGICNNDTMDAAVPVDAGQTDASVADSGPGADAAVDAGEIGEVNPFDGIGALTLERDGFGFIVGPAWSEESSSLVFSDINLAVGSGVVQEYNPASGTSTSLQNLTRGAAGNAFDSVGRLHTCEWDGRRVTRFVSGTVEPVADGWMGMAFNSPWGIVIRSDSVIYVTDPPHGLGGRPREIPGNGVFRIDPSSMVVEAEWIGDENTTAPKGIALSPDESVLYVGDSRESIVRAFDVQAGGSLDNERVFATSIDGPDGMAVDVAGNLYVASSSGVVVLAPGGTIWGTIATPGVPTGCAFGGADKQTLFITQGSELYSIRLPVRGF